MSKLFVFLILDSQCFACGEKDKDGGVGGVVVMCDELRSGWQVLCQRGRRKRPQCVCWRSLCLLGHPVCSALPHAARNPGEAGCAMASPWHCSRFAS